VRGARGSGTSSTVTPSPNSSIPATRTIGRRQPSNPGIGASSWIRDGARVDVPSEPCCPDRNSTNERVGVGKVVVDSRCADRPGGMAAVDASHEREPPAAVVVDDGSPLPSGDRVVCALEGEASRPGLQRDAPGRGLEVRVATGRSGSRGQRQAGDRLRPGRAETDDLRL
jgi:hypothetical protein